MSTWFKLLPLDLQDVKELVEPIDEIKEGETVVGTVSEDLKKLWTLSRAGKKAAELLAVELSYTPPGATPERAKASEQVSKARIMEMLFWIGVMDELQLWGHPEQCGLRVGWQVVEFKPAPASCPFGFFPGSQQ